MRLFSKDEKFWMITHLEEHEKKLKASLRLSKKYRKKIEKGLPWRKERHDFMRQKDIIF